MDSWLNWQLWAVIGQLAVFGFGIFVGWDARSIPARFDASVADAKIMRLGLAARAFIAHQHSDEYDRRRVELHAAIDAALDKTK